jgi:hypothetical protein
LAVPQQEHEILVGIGNPVLGWDPVTAPMDFNAPLFPHPLIEPNQFSLDVSTVIVLESIVLVGPAEPSQIFVGGFDHDHLNRNKVAALASKSTYVIRV